MSKGSTSGRHEFYGSKIETYRCQDFRPTPLNNDTKLAGATTQDSMSLEVTDCQDCGETGKMQNTGAVCSSVCVVSVSVDKTAINTTTLLNAKKTQFEIQNSRLHERSEYPEPHPPKYTS